MDIEIGQRIGKLTVLAKTKKKKGPWNVAASVCKCDCGIVKTFRDDYLKSGRVRSCGCARIEAARRATMKHGLSKCSANHHPLYDVWSSMIQRCHNPRNKGYQIYGARGIAVCEEWRKDFSKFYAWVMANGYEHGLQIDRINVNKGYSPENCRLVTAYVQARNKRTNIYVTYQGKRMTLQDAANAIGVKRSTVYYRYMHGKPLDVSSYGN